MTRQRRAGEAFARALAEEHPLVAEEPRGVRGDLEDTEEEAEAEGHPQRAESPRIFGRQPGAAHEVPIHDDERQYEAGDHQ
ncbi:hypothetical protein [Nannocystis exedens]|uniref:hypothetical protein n=1 Tax=Nannocystis exedens TaxID=54 RepID=UPI00116033CF|nr:hypothetical protein [Nannocystis exedens]